MGPSYSYGFLADIHSSTCHWANEPLDLPVQFLPASWLLQAPRISVKDRGGNLKGNGMLMG